MEQAERLLKTTDEELSQYPLVFASFDIQNYFSLIEKHKEDRVSFPFLH